MSAPNPKPSTIFREAKAFSSFSVKNLVKAKEFYGNTLGLVVTQQTEGLEMKLGDGQRVFLYPKPEIKTDKKGIMRGPGPQIAWFKDPDGNILSVVQPK